MVYDNLKNIESYIDNRPDSAMANICLIDKKNKIQKKQNTHFYVHKHRLKTMFWELMISLLILL